MRNFTSGFAPDLNGMIDLKMALNYSESTYLERGRVFDLFCAEQYPDANIVTEGLAVS